MAHRNTDYLHRKRIKSTVNYGGAVIYGDGCVKKCNCHIKLVLMVSFHIFPIIVGFGGHSRGELAGSCLFLDNL
ncbi:hypothetical protein HanPI659440_Chr04g0146461 [Helianthus annuus]|nr:hypothetical protein HanPI659440_Chr04g0146461 [Helianthus annuus]